MIRHGPLDTNFLILAHRAGTHKAGRLDGWLADDEQIGVSAIAWADFLCGPLLAEDAVLARTLFADVEPLLPADAERGADLFNATGRRSRTLADCLIAATALRCGADPATGNVADFQPFVSHGLQLL